MSIIECLIYFSDALGIIYMQSEPLATANDSCHMSRDIVWLSGWGTRLGCVALHPIHSIQRQASGPCPACIGIVNDRHITA